MDPTTVPFSQPVLDLLSQPSVAYLTALRVKADAGFATHGHAWSFAAVKP